MIWLVRYVIGPLCVIYVWPSPELELLTAERADYSQVFFLLGLPAYAPPTPGPVGMAPPAC